MGVLDMLPNKMVEKIKENKEHQTEKYIYRYFSGRTAEMMCCKSYILRYDKSTKESITVWKEPLEEQEVLPLDTVSCEADDETSNDSETTVCNKVSENDSDTYIHNISEVNYLGVSDQLHQIEQMMITSLNNVKKEFIKIGFCLYWIKRKNLYDCSNYQNIYEYALNEFNISRGTCNEYINIAERFCKRDDHRLIIPELQEEYSNYSSSQLALMQRMDNSQLEKVNENMTIREMKDLMKPDDEASASVTSSGTQSMKKPKIEKLYTINNKDELLKNLDSLKYNYLYAEFDKFHKQSCHIEINLVYDSDN